MPSAGATSAAVISKMKEIFAEHGVPDILRSDNGPQYASAAFTEFVEEWEFQHTTSSPHFYLSIYRIYIVLFHRLSITSKALDKSTLKY